MDEGYFLWIMPLLSMNRDGVTPFIRFVHFGMYWTSLYLILYHLRHLRRFFLFLEYLLLPPLLNTHSRIIYAALQFICVWYYFTGVHGEVVLHLNISFSKSKSLVGTAVELHWHPGAHLLTPKTVLAEVLSPCTAGLLLRTSPHFGPRRKERIWTHIYTAIGMPLSRLRLIGDRQTPHRLVCLSVYMSHLYILKRLKIWWKRVFCESL